MCLDSFVAWKNNLTVLQRRNATLFLRQFPVCYWCRTEPQLAQSDRSGGFWFIRLIRGFYSNYPFCSASLRTVRWFVNKNGSPARESKATRIQSGGYPCSIDLIVIWTGPRFHQHWEPTFGSSGLCCLNNDCVMLWVTLALVWEWSNSISLAQLSITRVLDQFWVVFINKFSWKTKIFHSFFCFRF